MSEKGALRSSSTTSRSSASSSASTAPGAEAIALFDKQLAMFEPGLGTAPTEGEQTVVPLERRPKASRKAGGAAAPDPGGLTSTAATRPQLRPLRPGDDRGERRGRLVRLVPTPWARAAQGVLDHLPIFRSPLPAPGPFAQVTHAGTGSAPRYVRRHQRQIAGDQGRRRNRRARARYLRLVAAKGVTR